MCAGVASLYVEVFATYDLRLNVVGVLVGAVVVVVVLCSFLGCAVLGPCSGVFRLVHLAQVERVGTALEGNRRLARRRPALVTA